MPLVTSLTQEQRAVSRFFSRLPGRVLLQMNGRPPRLHVIRRSQHVNYRVVWYASVYVCGYTLNLANRFQVFLHLYNVNKSSDNCSVFGVKFEQSRISSNTLSLQIYTRDERKPQIWNAICTFKHGLSLDSVYGRMRHHLKFWLMESFTSWCLAVLTPSPIKLAYNITFDDAYSTESTLAVRKFPMHEILFTLTFWDVTAWNWALELVIG